MRRSRVSNIHLLRCSVKASQGERSISGNPSSGGNGPGEARDQIHIDTATLHHSAKQGRAGGLRKVANLTDQPLAYSGSIRCMKGKASAENAAERRRRACWCGELRQRPLSGGRRRAKAAGLGW